MLQFHKLGTGCLCFGGLIVNLLLKLGRILNENLPKDESNRFQRIELTKPKLLEYFPPFYTKPQMENVIFGLLEQWKKENEKENT